MVSTLAGVAAGTAGAGGGALAMRAKWGATMGGAAPAMRACWLCVGFFIPYNFVAQVRRIRCQRNAKRAAEPAGAA